MPYVQRKKSIVTAIKSILLAPVALLFVGIVTGLPFLILGAILCVWCMWMAGEPWGNVMPTQEQFIVCLIVVAFVALAAIPLAIRDYFSNGGYETVWEPSADLDEFARTIGNQLLAGDHDSVYACYSDELKSEVTRTQFEQRIRSVHDKLGRWVDIENACEVPGLLCRDASALVRVEFLHDSRLRSTLDLHLLDGASRQIVFFAYDEQDEDEDQW